MTERVGLGSRSTQYNLFPCRPFALSAHMKAAAEVWMAAWFRAVMLPGNGACIAGQGCPVWQPELLHLALSMTG